MGEWDAPPPAERLPVGLVTGFFGSGKTTLVNHLLRQKAAANTVVIVNELGEIGLDHDLVVTARENVTLLASGCLCCSLRGDLQRTLTELYLLRVRRTIPAFTRVLVETTGLADPGPVMNTLMLDELVATYYRLDGVVATVDAAAGMGSLDRHREAVKQAALADRLVLTKTDLASPATVAALTTRLASLNPGARVVTARQGEIDPALLFGLGLWDDARRARLDAWLGEGADEGHGHSHDDGIVTHAFALDRPVERAAFEAWFELVALLRGPDLLRLKGIVNVAGAPRPLVVHAVQHVLHPPVELDAWPGDDRRTRLVVIARNVPRAAIASTMARLETIPVPAT
ncbi:MAG: GTP-binding protein [Alphaproteobacteria bacterium]|nr:GTP-binding protein [Alphaproteobacteria bacterium]